MVYDMQAFPVKPKLAKPEPNRKSKTLMERGKGEKIW
ncbi:MAG: hypothetical protein FD174_1677 [Geobacteraceae bacterium]|nr:MAG: hypothetical protein FD174_1677 [Geobacteraceae bacterium]